MSSGKSRLSLKLGQRKLFQLKPKSPPHQSEAARSQPPESSGSSRAGPTALSPSFSGLSNLGNTCYANSVLQVLRFCPGFVSELSALHAAVISTKADEPPQSPAERGDPCDDEAMESDAATKEPAKDKLASHLHSLWLRMQAEEQKRGTAVEPFDFISQLKEEQPLFDNQLQHDAQEMLRYLLTILQDTCNSIQSLANGHPTHLPTTPTTSNACPCDHPTIITIDDDDEEKECAKVESKKRKKLSISARKPTKKLKLSKANQLQLTAFFTPTKQVDGARILPMNPIVHTPIKKKPKTTDFVAEMFQGSLAYQLRCFECDSCTRRTEPFLDLSVPVGNQDLPGFPSGVSPLKSGSNGAKMVGPYSLSWALAQFAFKEKLRGENKYWCDCCGHFCEAERSILISELPAVMTVHLNRFATQVWGGMHSTSIMVSKMGGNLAVPLVINFSQWCSSECKNRKKMYSLFAVVFHSGSSCTSGHYTACVREKEASLLTSSEVKGHHWLYFDDEQVERLSEDQVADMLSPLSYGSYTAYILFYT